jgi:DNA repair protein RecN (Recombination protein N)
MLSHLSIQDYTIVDRLDMEFDPGMTVITGETGAGKSIMLDALGLCLGDRADPRAVRSGCERAEIIAGFSISRLGDVQRWLADRELAAGDECLLRRVITREGRSRAFINGKACTLQDCAELGGQLIDIHNQHAHQSLLRRDNQRRLLDEFAGQSAAARELEQLASAWLRGRRELEALRGTGEEQQSRAQLLAYQVEELEELAVQEGELQELEARQKRLANAEHILQTAQQALALCETQESGSRQALQLLSDDALASNAIDDVRELLDSAAIQLGEAHSELQRYLESVEIDPGQLAEVEQRLDRIYSVARKHRVNPQQVAGLHDQLAAELDALRSGDERADALAAELDELRSRYTRAAEALGKQRRKAAKKLSRQVEKQLSELAMADCRLQIALHPRDGEQPHPHGAEDVEFRVSTNPGQEPQPLGKIASGGELSRISLAIQVVTASTGTVPSMVFDEVDVGVGGAVAEVVGQLLRKLAGSAQVLCVTHLPQVASQGQQHLRVTKQSSGKQTSATLARLDDASRVEEVARMLGGIDITEQTRAHAREMVDSAISS